jgi:hypothetical protein
MLADPGHDLLLREIEEKGNHFPGVAVLDLQAGTEFLEVVQIEHLMLAVAEVFFGEFDQADAEDDTHEETDSKAE